MVAEFLTPFWFTIRLNEYEIEFMFRKLQDIGNLGNVHIRGPYTLMSRIDAQTA